jgi:hypothetical protein
VKRATTRLRRFQLSMQCWAALCWSTVDGVWPYGLRREIVLGYAALAQWRSGVFRV